MIKASKGLLRRPRPSSWRPDGDTLSLELVGIIEPNIEIVVASVHCDFLFHAREEVISSYQYQQEIEAHTRIVVGVNAYGLEGELAPPLLRIDPDLERQQIARLQVLRAQRNNAPVKRALQRLEQAARGSENLMPLLVEAVECYATLGEIADTLRGVFGEHQEQIVLTEA